MEKQLIPQLRFPEFDETDEEVRVLDIVEFKSGGTPKKDNKLYWNGNIPWISASSMIGKYYYKSERKITNEGLNNGSKLAPKNTLLLLVRGSMLYNKIPIGITETDVAFNQDLKSLIPNSKVKTEYLYQWFCSKENQLLNMVVGTGIGAGKLETDDIKSLKVLLPSIKEQQKIAAFLTDVDNKITQLTKKKELLEQYKKGILQKIFNQELRFKDENGNEFPKWEVKKLGEIASINKGKQLNAEFLTDIGTYPCISGGINPSGYTEDFNTDANIITISEGGNSCGYVNFFKTKFWCGGHCYSIQNLSKDVMNEFLFQLLKYNEIKIMRLRVGSGLPNIQKKDITSFKITLPVSLKEQTKIANFLSDIDIKIEVLNTKIENSKNFKKGLLQKMFV